jgi:hypothetical protein
MAGDVVAAAGVCAPALFAKSAARARMAKKYRGFVIGKTKMLWLAVGEASRCASGAGAVSFDISRAADAPLCLWRDTGARPALSPYARG